jgi:hypothetical protein
MSPSRIPALDGWRGLAIVAALALSFIAAMRFIHVGKSMEQVSADSGMPWTHTDLTPVWVGSRLIPVVLCFALSFSVLSPQTHRPSALRCSAWPQ